MRILVITGAGISAESGIPTFRGKDGYWRNLDPMRLATPEAFEDDPSLVWEWYEERRKWIREAQPNPAHMAIVDLAKHVDDFLLVTQNVDDLHARAGLPKEKMVQIHGDIFVNRCSRCDFGDSGGGGSPDPPATNEDDPRDGRLGSIAPTFSQSKLDGLKPSSLTSESGDDLVSLRKCGDCGALMRPGVVWFGEQLDPRKIHVVEDFLARGDVDVTLVIGTTALFGYIIDWATRGSRRLIEINPDETPLTQLATESIREPAGIALPRLAASLTAENRLA